MQRPFVFLMIAGLMSAPALAVEGETPAAEAAAPAESQPKPKPKAQDKMKMRAAGKAQDADKSKDKDKAKRAEKPAMSRSAYVRLLAAELRRHTPKTADDKTGSVHVAFTIGASGRVVSHKVRTSTNPALDPVVGQILAAVHTPPPPGGSFSAVQEFNFH
jgi:TonB family protein